MKMRTDIAHSGSFVSSSATSDWSRVAARGHGVQFYNTDSELLRSLVRYVGSALVGGDITIVIATVGHRRALERQLAARGLDVAVPRAQRRYIAADAQATLDAFLVEGRVHEERALETLDSLLNGVAGVAGEDGNPARIFAFGEMVALVAARSGPEEAIRLEQIWNRLNALYGFTLCCGYPMTSFSPRHAAPFVRICALHSNVFHAAIS
jgi:MEDS: MEthanogen/methylotroph, DcmR Sensory domain